MQELEYPVWKGKRYHWEFKTKPAASITLIIMDIYSSIANSFFIASDPNCAANES
jgi:hypothetical protein